MKIMKFGEFFMQEEVTLPIAHGTIDITDQATALNINTMLARALDQEFLTPYIALEKVRQVLTRFSIHLEGTTKLFDGDEGSFTFAVMQFGGVVDATVGGDIGIDVDKTRFIYFTWELNEEGTFDVFASVVTTDELSEIMDDEDEEDIEDAEEESVLDIDLVPEMATEAVKTEKPGITMTKIGNIKNFHFQYKGFDWQGTAWDKKEAYSKGMDAYEKHVGSTSK